MSRCPLTNRFQRERQSPESRSAVFVACGSPSYRSLPLSWACESVASASSLTHRPSRHMAASASSLGAEERSEFARIVDMPLFRERHLVEVYASVSVVDPPHVFASHVCRHFMRSRCYDGTARGTVRENDGNAWRVLPRPSQCLRQPPLVEEAPSARSCG